MNGVRRRTRHRCHSGDTDVHASRKGRSHARYGATIEVHGITYKELYDRAIALVESDGLTFVHPFDDSDVIAGQGTVGLEHIDEFLDVDTIVVPLGGGHISGVVTTVRLDAPGLASAVSKQLAAPTPNCRSIAVKSNRGRNLTASSRASPPDSWARGPSKSSARKWSS